MRPCDGDGPPPAARLIRKTFLVVNAVPLAVGILVSCATALAEITVYGRVTLGVVWGLLQLGVFLGSVWWYESRTTSRCDHADGPPPSGPPRSAADASLRAGW
ncbi:hypothetical protein ACWGK1_22550 [Streptomyces wedmorensis]